MQTKCGGRLVILVQVNALFTACQFLDHLIMSVGVAEGWGRVWYSPLLPGVWNLTLSKHSLKLCSKVCQKILGFQIIADKIKILAECGVYMKVYMIREKNHTELFLCWSYTI